MGLLDILKPSKKSDDVFANLDFASAEGGDADAMTVSTVYACHRILSSGVAMMPVQNFDEADSGLLTGQPLRPWMKRPSPFLTWNDLMSQVMNSLLVSGNAYLATVRDKNSLEIQMLWALDPDLCELSLDKRTFEKVLTVDGKTYSSLDFLHVPGMMMPGALLGMSPLDAARGAVKNASESQTAAEKVFSQGHFPSVVLEFEKHVSPEARQNIVEGWRSKLSGASNAGKLAVLTEGVKASPWSLSPSDTQFLQSREFQVAEILRFYGIPPHLVSDSSKATDWGSGISELNTATVLFTFNEWVGRLEAAFSGLASSENLSSRSAVKFSTIHLTHGDFSTRIASYKTGIEAGILLEDEARQFLGLAKL